MRNEFHQTSLLRPQCARLYNPPDSHPANSLLVSPSTEIVIPLTIRGGFATQLLFRPSSIGQTSVPAKTKSLHPKPNKCEFHQSKNSSRVSWLPNNILHSIYPLITFPWKCLLLDFPRKLSGIQILQTSSFAPTSPAFESSGLLTHRYNRGFLPLDPLGEFPHC